VSLPATGRRATILLELGVIILLVVANGFFAGAEIAVVAVRKTRLDELAEAGQRGARAVLALRARPERFFATVQIGITLVGATAAAYGGQTFAANLEPVLSRIPGFEEHAKGVALGVVVAAVSYLSIVIGELVPKSLALRGAETYALSIGRMLLVLSWLARPLVWLLTKSSNALLAPFGDRTTFTEARHSATELQDLVEEAARTGAVHPDAGEIASRALEFPDLTAEDVMIPRQQVVMIPRHASPDAVRTILLENTHTRMPVYEEEVDNVVGYVSVKDLLSVAWEQRLIVLEDVMRPAFFVPESQRAVDLLRDMRTRHTPFAIIVDEQGGMSGIVTMEDLLEELVGEIFSEHVRQVPALIEREPSGASALVSGSVTVRDVNRELSLELPEEGDWTTVAGMCVAFAGRIPAAGERVPLPGGLVLEVVKATARHVEIVRVPLGASERA
jgi:putative hemolysin